MKHSETFANLAAALVAAQADIKGVGKDSVNPHFRNKYASLDAIIESVRPVLAKHGLAVLQGASNPITEPDGGLVGFAVETMLVHKSGEWMLNAALMPLAKVDPQGAGGALTYGRRYGLSALLSLSTDEDDDGNTASQPRAASNGSSAPKAAPRENRDTYASPAERPMPFGKTKGKKLGEHTTEQLQKTITWCRDTDAEKFKDLIGAIGDLLTERALAPVGPGDDDLPF